MTRRWTFPAALGLGLGRGLTLGLGLTAAPAAAQPIDCANPGCETKLSPTCLNRVGAGAIPAGDVCEAEQAAYIACLTAVAAQCPAGAAPTQGAAGCAAEDARILWADLKDSPDPAALEAFAADCPGSPFARQAALRAQRLRGQGQAGAAKPAAAKPADAKPAAAKPAPSKPRLADDLARYVGFWRPLGGQKRCLAELELIPWRDRGLYVKARIAADRSLSGLGPLARGETARTFTQGSNGVLSFAPDGAILRARFRAQNSNCLYRKAAAPPPDPDQSHRIAAFAGAVWRRVAGPPNRCSNFYRFEASPNGVLWLRSTRNAPDAFQRHATATDFGAGVLFFPAVDDPSKPRHRRVRISGDRLVVDSGATKAVCEYAR